MPKLLCITAHPDDEAGAFGGTLALYAERGVEISVMCLIGGTAARNRGSAGSEDELAQMRTRELADSCRLLGVKHCEVLGYRDAHLAEADLVKVVGELVRRMREFRPHVILTFGPDGGMTGHLDHAMAGVFATIAYEWAMRTDRYTEQNLLPHGAQKLYYHTTDFRLADRQATAPPVVTCSIEIGSNGFEKKIAAFMQHKTQEPLFDRLRNNLEHPPFHEHYHLACSRELRTISGVETDLFANVADA